MAVTAVLKMRAAAFVGSLQHAGRGAPCRGYSCTSNALGNAAGPAGRVQEPPASLLPLLQALPGLGQHAAVVPFVVRSIQPLLSLGKSLNPSMGAGFRPMLPWFALYRFFAVVWAATVTTWHN